MNEQRGIAFYIDYLSCNTLLRKRFRIKRYHGFPLSLVFFNKDGNSYFPASTTATTLIINILCILADNRVK